MIKIHRTKLNSLRLRPISQFLALNLLKDGVYLGGGALRSLLDGTEIKDYDLFFRNKEVYMDARGTLIALGAKLTFECPKHELVTYEYKGMKIQLITLAFYPNVQTCINTFDLNACVLGLDYSHFYISRAAIKDIRKKTISLNMITYPVATLKRIIKYEKKGYKITGALLSLVEFLHKTSPNTELNMRIYAD